MEFTKSYFISEKQCLLTPADKTGTKWISRLLLNSMKQDVLHCRKPACYSYIFDIQEWTHAII